MTVAALLPARTLKTSRTDTAKLDILKRNLVEEARARVGRGRAVGATRGRIRQEQALAGARDGDVGQAALFLELARIIAAAKVVTCGKMPSSMPATNTAGNSRPLAEWMVIMVMACVSPARESKSERRASHSMRAGSALQVSGP